MQTIRFISLHGTELYGKVGAEQKIRRNIVKFVYKLGRIYAVVNGSSVDEIQETEDFGEFVKRVGEAI